LKIKVAVLQTCGIILDGSTTFQPINIMNKKEMLEQISDSANQIGEIVNSIEHMLQSFPDDQRRFLCPEFLGALSASVGMGKGYEAAFRNGPTFDDLIDLIESEVDEEENEENYDEE